MSANPDPGTFIYGSRNFCLWKNILKPLDLRPKRVVFKINLIFYRETSAGNKANPQLLPNHQGNLVPLILSKSLLVNIEQRRNNNYIQYIVLTVDKYYVIIASLPGFAWKISSQRQGTPPHASRTNPSLACDLNRYPFHRESSSLVRHPQQYYMVFLLKMKYRFT